MYTESRPDYFPVIYTSSSWRAVLQQLDEVPGDEILCLHEQGFTTAGKVYAFWQSIKRYLGFTDQTDETRVGARLMQFFFQGAARGFVQENQALFNSVAGKMQWGITQVHQAVKGVFPKINSPAGIRADLVKFYEDNREVLQPTFWNRIGAKEISLSKNSHFGEVHLLLAEQQIAKEPDLAFQNFSQAVQLYNAEDSRYTDRLIQSFQTLAIRHPGRTAEIGAIRLLLAERKYRTDNWQEAYDLFTSVWNSHVPFSQREKALFLVTAAALNRFDETEMLSKEISPEGLDATVKQAYTRAMNKLWAYRHLSLAEDAYRKGNFKEAYDLFASAWDLKVPLSQHQSTLFLILAASEKQFSIVEKLFDTIFPERMDPTLKEPYARAITQLGDLYLSKNGTLTTKFFQVVTLGWTPSSEDHCRKAFAFYQKAHLARATDSLFQKILAVAEHLPDADLLRVDSRSYSQEKDEISRLLIVMKGKKLMHSVERRKAISQFTREVAALYQTKVKGSADKCLYWIEEALKCIGPIRGKEELLYTTRASLFSSTREVQSNVPDLLTKGGDFAVPLDMGAGLHFLRAEILQSRHGNTREVHEAYKLAANLAPQNPFGAGGLFMEDGQQTLASHLESHIKAHRNLAIEWGARP